MAAHKDSSLPGLSPLARGNRAGRVYEQDAMGPIPARAGQPTF